MRFLILFAAACTPTVASVITDAPIEGPPVDERDVERQQVCLFGATNYEDGGNPDLARICEGFPNLLRNPLDDHPGFRITELTHTRDTLITTLDTDGDGTVTDEDAPILFDIVGYSWGGVNTSMLDLHADERVLTERLLIGRMVLIDPFIPPADTPLPILGEVEAVWSYVHTEAPPWDCSTFAPVGPYLGRPLDCGSTNAPCMEYDLSLRMEVGHCSIVSEVGEWVGVNLIDGTSPAPSHLEVMR